MSNVEPGSALPAAHSNRMKTPKHSTDSQSVTAFIGVAGDVVAGMYSAHETMRVIRDVAANKTAGLMKLAGQITALNAHLRTLVSWDYDSYSAERVQEVFHLLTPVHAAICGWYIALIEKRIKAEGLPLQSELEEARTLVEEFEMLYEDFQDSVSIGPDADRLESAIAAGR